MTMRICPECGKSAHSSDTSPRPWKCPSCGGNIPSPSETNIRNGGITMNEDIYKELIRKANYALNSKSLVLTYQIYGEACMAMQLEAITKEQYFELNEILVVNGMNNPKAGLE